MNTRILLPGLIGSHPLGALASFGLFRKLSDWDRDARLVFSMQDDWVAEVHTSQVRSLAELVSRFSEYIASNEIDSVLSWTDDDVRVPPDEFQRALRSAVASCNRELADYLTSMAADGAVDMQKKLVKPSAFYMVSGQQSFLGGMREILAQVRSDAQSAVEEALVGPWRYRTQAHSLGWDPGTERLHALRHRAPTSEKAVCVGAAVVLAFLALPLFPSVANAGRVATTGFSRVGREQYFTWPIWTDAICLDELRSLLHAGTEQWISEAATVARRGIAAVYRSRRSEFGQGYAILKAAELVASAALRS
jgi:hypothetical protein